MTDYSSFSARRRARGNGTGIMFKLKMFAATIFVVFLIISFFWGESGLIRMWYLDKKIDRLKNDIRILKVQRNDLLWETDKIEHNADYIQRYAVETYGYARPDQKIIQFVPADSTGGARESGELKHIKSGTKRKR